MAEMGDPWLTTTKLPGQQKKTIKHLIMEAADLPTSSTHISTCQ
jgi:hypothetical protein